MFFFWMCYVVWVIIVLMIFFSVVIFILYSMLWGKVKLNEWLLFFMFFFFEFVMCVDFLKVRNVEFFDNILIFCKKGVLLYNYVNEYLIFVFLRYCLWLYCFFLLLKILIIFDILSLM